jgi:hypothetical protein
MCLESDRIQQNHKQSSRLLPFIILFDAPNECRNGSVAEPEVFSVILTVAQVGYWLAYGSWFDRFFYGWLYSPSLSVIIDHSDRVAIFIHRQYIFYAQCSLVHVAYVIVIQ